MTGRGPICLGCIHLMPRPGMRCKAYPDGIPEAIYTNQADHRQPFADDNGVRFEPKNAESSAYAEELFPSESRP